MLKIAKGGGRGGGIKLVRMPKSQNTTRNDRKEKRHWTRASL
jgi:hypothetical protein